MHFIALKLQEELSCTCTHVLRSISLFFYPALGKNYNYLLINIKFSGIPSGVNQ